MNIGLNATCLTSRPSGANQRFRGIYGALFELLPDVEFTIYEPDDCRVGSWFPGRPNVTSVTTPIPSTGRWRKFAAGRGFWPGALAQRKFGLFECFHLPVVQAPGGRNLMTIHDVRGLQHAGGALERMLFRTVLRQALGRTDRVITVSEAMRQEILAFEPTASVSVIYNGLDAEPFRAVTPQQAQDFRRRFGLAEGFVLTVGHIERRKNYPVLVDAMAVAKSRGVDAGLVVIGNDSGDRHLLQQRIVERGLLGRVHLLSGLDDDDVRCAYASCGLFVFPSSYEGFGIPLLEAMAARRPVVASDLPVFREITQNEALYFPPHDAEAMAEAIVRGLASDSERQRLVAYGDRRIADFGFPHLAAGLAKLYGELQ